MARHPAGPAPVQLGRECGAEERSEILSCKERFDSFGNTEGELSGTPPRSSERHRNEASPFGSLLRRVVRKDAASGPERLHALWDHGRDDRGRPA